MPALSYSEYLGHAKNAVRHCQSAVRYRGINTPVGPIRHPFEFNNLLLAGVANFVVGRVMDAYMPPANRPDFIKRIAMLGRVSQTGNCSELSGIAYEYLDNEGIYPLDYFAVWRGSWTHAFLILNRDPSIPIKDFKKWSEYAIVCDPLYDRAANASHLSVWYPRMFPLKDKDLWYRLEED